METITARKQINGITRVDMEEYFDDVEVDSLYQWIDRIPLSRPKKNITKDFSDGVLAAEIVKHYFPRMVELHNYVPAAATKQRLENWYLLNRRVLRKLDLDLSDDVLRALAHCKPKVIERVLMLLRLQIDKFLEKTGRDSVWRRKELYYQSPDPALRLSLNSPPSHPNTPPGVKSPRDNRSVSPGRMTKSEPATASPRKYNKGEVPHGHPDRTISRLSRRLSRFSKVDLEESYHSGFRRPSVFNKRELEEYNPRRYRIDALAFDFLGYPYTDRYSYAPRGFESYFADKPLQIVPKPFLPPLSDNVPKVLYEEKEMECHAKEETIQILNAKIRRLEHLIHLKDVRIEDLHSSLQQTIGLGYSVNRRR